jgi:hypothetical protein
MDNFKRLRHTAIEPAITTLDASSLAVEMNKNLRYPIPHK